LPKNIGYEGIVTKLIGAEELAQNLSISPQTLYAWARKKKIPHFRLGGGARVGRILFDPQEIEKWLKDNKSP